MIRRPKDRHGFEAVPAVVVADQTNKSGKRLGYIAIAMLVLFFVISGYIQSSKNGRMLKHADNDRSALIHSVNELTRTNNQQIRFIKRLQQAIRDQNKILKKAGFETVPVPQNHTEPNSVINPPNGPGSNPTARPSHRSEPKPKPSSTSKPTPSPTPTNDPITKIRNRVCSLTGICTFNLISFFKF